MLFLHISSRYCILSTTLGSIIGGKGSPVTTTPRQYVSAKSNPSLALGKDGKQEMCWYYWCRFIKVILLHQICIVSPFLYIQRRSFLRWSLGLSAWHNSHQSPARESNFRTELTEGLCTSSYASILLVSTVYQIILSGYLSKSAFTPRFNKHGLHFLNATCMSTSLREWRGLVHSKWNSKVGKRWTRYRNLQRNLKKENKKYFIHFKNLARVRNMLSNF